MFVCFWSSIFLLKKIREKVSLFFFKCHFFACCVWAGDTMCSVELVQSSLALNSGRMVKAELVERNEIPIRLLLTCLAICFRVHMEFKKKENFHPIIHQYSKVVLIYFFSFAVSNRKNFLFESDRLSFIRLQNEKKKALAMTVMVALPIVSHMSAGCCKVWQVDSCRNRWRTPTAHVDAFNSSCYSFDFCCESHFLFFEEEKRKKKLSESRLIERAVVGGWFGWNVFSVIWIGFCR